MKRRISSQPTKDAETENKKSVILNEVKNLSVSATDECRTSLEILRYTQDDSRGENKKSVILNGVKNLSVSATYECRTDLEILRYTQDDRVNRKQKTNKLIT